MERTQTLDITRAENFANSMLDTLNKSALSLMISIGHRSGLFDTMGNLGFAALDEITGAANLNERYTKEWLGAMVTGGIVEYSSVSDTYRLPAEHAAFLTRSAGSDNYSVFMQYASVMGEVEDEILRCFSEGGGVPYSKFHRFHEVMAEDSGQSVLSSLETHILQLVPGLTGKLEKGIRVLDLGCGSGRIINRLASLYPGSQFEGIDLSAEAIAKARKEAFENELENIEFVVKDLSDYHESAPVEEYDLITTFDAIHDQGKPLNVLKGIFRALKNDGIYLMQDISGTGNLEQDKQHPLGPFLYTISCMHCMTVSLAQDGEGVGAMWGEELTRDYLKKAGFTSIVTNRLDHDIQNNWYVIKK